MRQLYFFLLLFSVLASAQEKPIGSYTVEADYFYGNILPHRKSIYHLITTHPEGMMLSFNRKTFGDKPWQAAYNYPDYGLSFQYQDMKNQSLGEMYGVYAHYNFYFLERYLMLRIGQGIAYNTNPYDRDTNFRNYAYGASIMPTTYFMLNFVKEDIWHGVGLKAGLIFIHHSNASMKAPNTSTNTFAVNVGVSYAFDRYEKNQYIPRVFDSIRFKQPVKVTIAFRGGVNESDLIGSGQYPYYAASVYADKRWTRKSAFQLGADVFWAKYLEEQIKFKSVSYPEENLDPDTDYRKVGMFIGHELFINKFSLETQAGWYVYAPYKSTGSHYQRVGMKYYFSEKIFGGMGLKTHGAKAEVLEFAIGVRM